MELGLRCLLDECDEILLGHTGCHGQIASIDRVLEL
jgi:hypothetical protein